MLFVFICNIILYTFERNIYTNLFFTLFVFCYVLYITSLQVDDLSTTFDADKEKTSNNIHINSTINYFCKFCILFFY